MRARVIPLKILATALTVGTGGSAGREGPIVHIGGAIGSVISRRFNLGEDQVRSLVAAGAGAGIGAAFNAPIAGMLFALEVILSSFAARHMSAIVIASVTAAVTTQTLVGQELAIQTGAYELNHAVESSFSMQASRLPWSQSGSSSCAWWGSSTVTPGPGSGRWDSCVR